MNESRVRELRRELGGLMGEREALRGRQQELDAYKAVVAQLQCQIEGQQQAITAENRDNESSIKDVRRSLKTERREFARSQKAALAEFEDEAGDLESALDEADETKDA